MAPQDSSQESPHQSRAREQAAGEQAAGEPAAGEQTVGEQAAREPAAVEQAAPPSSDNPIPPPPSGPRAYFLTFTCYGTHLHGDEIGSVDRQHNVFGTLVIQPNPARWTAERRRMKDSHYTLDAIRRELVLEAIKEVCAYRGWWLFAAHVRTSHIHVVVQSGESPEPVMNDFKTYATRRLKTLIGEEPERKRWARHGSTRYLWKQEDLEGAIRYVLHEQGEPMAVYAGPGVTHPNPSEPRP